MDVTAILGVTDSPTESPGDSTTGIPDEASGGKKVVDMRVVMLCIGVLGVVGNGFVLFVIFSFTNMRKKVTNMFIINQSALDFLVSLLLIGDTATQFEDDYNTGLEGLAGKLYCKLMISRVFQWSLLVSSTYNLLAITVERYMMVVHPIVHKMAFTRKRAVYIIGGVWLMGAWYYLLTLPTHEIKDGKCYRYSRFPSATWQRVFGIATIAYQFFIPLLIHPTLYARMVAVMRSKTAAITQHQAGGRENQSVKKMSRTQKNLLKTMAIVTACFFLCWSWNQIAFFLHNIGIDYNLYSNFHLFTITAVNINCCVNPFIYIFKYDEFKNAVRKLIFGRLAQGQVHPSAGEHTSDTDGSTAAS